MAGEPAYPGILDEMDGAGEQQVVSRGAAYMNDPGVLEILRQDIDDELARLLIQPVEHLIDQDPRRRMQQRPRKGHRVLFVVVQFTIPTLRHVEHGNEP